MRFETTPGFQAQVNLKENFEIINKDGKEFEINIFLMILDYSRYKYIELTLDKSQDTLFCVTVFLIKYLLKKITYDRIKEKKYN